MNQQELRRAHGNWVSGDRFWDREEELELLAEYLEEGAHLLPWGSPTQGRVRFCHFSDEPAMEALLAESGLERAAAYTADGREGDLNRYYVLRRRA